MCPGLCTSPWRTRERRASTGGSVGSGYGREVAELAEHIAHVDMDAFFVEVERRRPPELRRGGGGGGGGGAFVEIGGLRPAYPSTTAVGEAIRRAVREQTGLPASVGLATCKLLAKLAGRAAKPDGPRPGPAGGGLAFLPPLPGRAPR